MRPSFYCIQQLSLQSLASASQLGAAYHMEFTGGADCGALGGDEKLE
jgi:hypothetical protein